jgi:hypothetical protein
MRTESTERSGFAQADMGATRSAARGGAVQRLRMIPVRSFFPVATLVVIVGSVVWGPWVSLALTAALWFAIDSLENTFLGSRRS